MRLLSEFWPTLHNQMTKLPMEKISMSDTYEFHKNAGTRLNCWNMEKILYIIHRFSICDWPDDDHERNWRVVK